MEFFEARHNGIKKARDKVEDTSAKVFSAVELIWISSTEFENEKVVKQIDFKLIDRLDEVKADYISYSLGSDCGVNNFDQFAKNLKSLNEKLDGRPFYIGEIQIAENEVGGELQKEYVLKYIYDALDKGAEFAIIWQIYSNEDLDEAHNKVKRDFWLIKNDDNENTNKTPLYNALKEMFPPPVTNPDSKPNPDEETTTTTESQNPPPITDPNPDSKPKPGDISGDGEPSQADVDLLSQYILNGEGDIDLTLADVTHDGVVDMRDATYLARAIAKWDGYPLG